MSSPDSFLTNRGWDPHQARTYAVLISVFMGYFPFVISLMIYSYKSRRMRIIRSLLRSIYFEFPIIDKEKENRIYRVTCYKYVSHFLSKSYYWLRNIRFRKREKKISYEYRRINPFSKKKEGYLVCYTRYGKEPDQTRDYYNTSIVFQVDSQKKSGTGFAGLVFTNEEEHFICINNQLVNPTVEKLRASEHILNNVFLSNKENRTAKEDIEYLQAWKDTILNSVHYQGDNPPVTEEEFAHLCNFMEKTNTNAVQLVDIGNGQHSNHFIGFKLFKGNENRIKHKAWGVVIIDTDDPRAFESICTGRDCFDNDANRIDKWISLILRFFIGIFATIFSTKPERSG